jgi:hypothetical protein
MTLFIGTFRTARASLQSFIERAPCNRLRLAACQPLILQRSPLSGVVTSRALSPCAIRDLVPDSDPACDSTRLRRDESGHSLRAAGSLPRGRRYFIGSGAGLDIETVKHGAPSKLARRDDHCRHGPGRRATFWQLSCASPPPGSPRPNSSPFAIPADVGIGCHAAVASILRKARRHSWRPACRKSPAGMLRIASGVAAAAASEPALSYHGARRAPGRV